jgi:hypothetical protein
VQNVHIFGQNENWIFVYFPGKFLAQMRNTRTKLAQSFSPFSAQDGRQVCRPAMNFSVTKCKKKVK